MNIEAVAVFCGSKNGNNPLYKEHAAELGKYLAMLKLKLIYGGAKEGLMGTVADVTGKTYDHIKVMADSIIPSNSESAFNSNDIRVHREAYTDGSGWYGLAGLPPGRYRVRIDKKEFAGQCLLDVQVQLGQVVEARFQ